MVIDLHTHSTASDGTKTPTEIIGMGLEEQERKKEPVTLALTDHDTVAGLSEFIKEAANYPDQIHAIPGIEITTYYKEETIHMLGYGIDYNREHLRSRLEQYRGYRDVRNERMIHKLQEHGIDITMDDILQEDPDASIGRPLMARHMMKMNYVKSVKEAFDQYLGEGKCCYIERIRPELKEVIDLIHENGGIAVLAHPVLYKKLDRQSKEELIEKLSQMGLDGMEVYYSRNSDADTSYYESLAHKYHLLLTGGSDYHGEVKPDISLFSGTGNLHVPETVLKDLFPKITQMDD